MKSEHITTLFFYNFNVFLPETKIKILCLITSYTNARKNVINNDTRVYN